MPTGFTAQQGHEWLLLLTLLIELEVGLSLTLNYFKEAYLSTSQR